MELLKRIRQIDQERHELVTVARHQALANVNKALDALNKLGLNYSLVAGGEKKSSAARRQVRDAECPVCKFRTSPPHDARAHRGQGDRKRPFTAAQLEERGFTPAGS